MNSNIRNVGIVAHVDAGKTTVTEHMLFLSGEVRALGKVDDGTAHTDFMEIERARGISVRAASVSFTWQSVRVNLIDTPGHIDFSAEVERALRVLDGAVLVISAVEGIQAQTEVLFRALQALKIPTIIFINKIDRVGADVRAVMDEFKERFTPNILPLQAVEGGDIKTIWNDTAVIPDVALEMVAEADEGLLEAYLNGGDLSFEQLDKGLVRAVSGAKVYPVVFGAALAGLGVSELLDAVVRYLPPPSGEVEGALSGVVFRIEHDKLMGKIAHVRLFSGALQNRDNVFNASLGIEEKVTQIRAVHGQKQKDVGVLQAGDIAAVCGLGSARIGDILGSGEGIPNGYQMAVPLLNVKVTPQEDGQFTRLVEAMQELADEDPLLDLQWVKEKRELHVKIMGAIQVEILTGVLKERFGLNAVFGAPSVIYKETPCQDGYGFAAYTMPKPCWAILRFLIEPMPRGYGVSYSSEVRDEHILMRYQNQVEKALPDALKQGNYGWEVTDLRITLVEGESHFMHTHPLDFIVTTPMAIMDGLNSLGTWLLEPILSFRITIPEELGGRVIGDIVNMRGSFDSPVIARGSMSIEGTMPLATSMDYPIRLGAISSGRGVISTRFEGYSRCALELGAVRERIGVNPLDRAKYILSIRHAL